MTLSVDDALVQQTIEDDGRGEAGQLLADGEQGQGLRIMAYRLESIGGRLRFENAADGSGIRITGTLPRRSKAPANPSTSATLEALENCLQRLETLSRRPESPERDEKELELQLELVPMLMANRGFAVPEVGVALERAHELCLRVPNRDSKQLFSAARGLWQFHQVRSELDDALAQSRELMDLAENAPDDIFLAEAHRIVGGTTLFRGELIESRNAFELGLETYNENSFFPAEDPLVLCLYEGAWANWLLGDLETARTRTAQAIAKARESENPFSLAAAKYGATILRALNRDIDSVVILGNELCELARELSFPLIQSVGRVPLGWALTMQGDPQRGLAEIRAGIAGCEATRTELQATMWKGFLADALRHTGHHSEALVVVENAQEMSLRNHELWWLAELQRLEGESSLAMWPHAPEKAEQCFRRALDTARARHARTWELRAATSLARLLAHRGSVESAREVLAPITIDFSDGPVNADVLDATRLLSELPD